MKPKTAVFLGYELGVLAFILVAVRRGHPPAWTDWPLVLVLLIGAVLICWSLSYWQERRS